jgi:hypothetical protein
MAIDFSNAIKAQITQGLIKTLFERAGYRVTRLGVEELFTEITYLDEAQYKALNLPLGLRFLPDLLVAEREMQHAYLLDGKYRREFTLQTMKSLHIELKRQREYWPASYAVIIIGTPFVKDRRFHQDYMRVLTPDRTNLLDIGSGALRGVSKEEIEERGEKEGGELIWDFIPRLTIFEKFSHAGDTSGNARNADLITAAIKELKKL